MTESTKPAREPITALSPDQPIWLAVDQTEHKTYVETFNGWDAEDRAKAYAAARAAKTERRVILFGPQVAIATPPEPVTTGTVRPVRLSRPEGEAAE